MVSGTLVIVAGIVLMTVTAMIIVTNVHLITIVTVASIHLATMNKMIVLGRKRLTIANENRKHNGVIIWKERYLVYVVFLY